MEVLISTNNLSITYTGTPIFSGLSWAVKSGAKVGLVGRSGAGKSTLLRLLAGQEEADTGELSISKDTLVAYVPQQESFSPEQTVKEILQDRLSSLAQEVEDWKVERALSQVGLHDVNTKTQTLSGGWRKRLSIACALVQQPTLLLMDEPTNHLDFAGLHWLEKLLNKATFSWIVVSHDRYFLQNTATSMMEIDKVYADGYYYDECSYFEFTEKKQAYLEYTAKQTESLKNKVRREREWLAQGAKARTTKAKHRINTAHKLMQELALVRTRQVKEQQNFKFTGTTKKRKELIKARSIEKSYADKKIIADLDLTLTSGKAIGILGPNGCGKSTLLHILHGSLKADAGSVHTSTDTQVLLFEQDRSSLDESKSLKNTLAPDGDSVIYQDRSHHIASWAQRFGFRPDQLQSKIAALSGGEKARVLLANLMRAPADVLLLDEPTNDLDITSIELLEKSLLEFTGAILLVSHDRYLLNRTCTHFIGVSSAGKWLPYASYSQWEEDYFQLSKKEPKSVSSTPRNKSKPTLTYLEKKELSTMEDSILKAEEDVEQLKKDAEQKEIQTDSEKSHEVYLKLQQALETTEKLYERWAELEERNKK